MILKNYKFSILLKPFKLSFERFFYLKRCCITCKFIYTLPFLQIFIGVTAKEMKTEEKLNEVIEALEDFFYKIIDTNTEEYEEEDNPTID